MMMYGGRRRCAQPLNGTSTSILVAVDHPADGDADVLAVLAGRGAVGRGTTRDPA